MAIHPGRRPGTWRVILWAKNRPNEWIVKGSKADAKTLEAKKRLVLDAAVPVEGIRASPEFSLFCQSRYTPHAIAHLKKSTWSKVRRYQVARLIKHFGKLKLNRFTVADVETFKQARLADGVGAASINNELRVLKTILRWAISLGLEAPVPPFKRLPIRGRPRVKAWTPAELDALFAAIRAESPEIEAMIVFLLNTGCRKGEAIAAEWSWIDLAAGLVRIPSNEFWQPKSGKPREVPISSALAKYLRRRPEGAQALFPNARGVRFVDFPKAAWWAASKRAGLTGGPHQLRHTFASMFLQKVPDLFLLARVLGHSHTRVTELYSHLLPGHLDRARNAVSFAPAKARKKKNHGSDHGQTL